MKYHLNLDQKVKLSSREIEIVQLITDEYSTKEIAHELFLSFETIKSHRKNIISKLHVKNVAGIVREALFRGIVEWPGSNLSRQHLNVTL